MKFKERDTSKPAEQQGIFRKFQVSRVDGSDVVGGKHFGCRYFVLDMDHDAHAPAALRAYADSCASTHPELAADLRREFGEAERTTSPVSQMTDEQGESLPCPFCGSADVSDGEILTEHPNGVTCTQSMCSECGALGPEAKLPAGEVDYGDVRAIAAWNRRPTEGLLRDFLTIIHDNGYALGDRLQCLSTRINGILGGDALDKYPAHQKRQVEKDIVEQEFDVEEARAILSGAATAIQQPQDERAAFETEIQNDEWCLSARKRENGEYQDPDVGRMWDGWQARADLAKKGGAA